MNNREHESQALRRRSYELSILNDVARALNASVDLPALLARALEKVTELLGLSTGWVLLFGEASGEPYVAAAQNLPPGLREEPKFLTSAPPSSAPWNRPGTASGSARPRDSRGS